VKPYYERGSIRLYHGLTEEIAPTFEEPGIVMTDCQYSPRVHAKSRAGARKKPLLDGNGRMSPCAISRAVDFGFEPLTDGFRTFLAQQAARLARRWALFFCDAEGLGKWADALDAAGIPYRTHLTWRKILGTPKFTGQESAVPDETLALASWDEEELATRLAVAHRNPSTDIPKRHWNGGGKLGWYEVRVASDGPGRYDNRIHETQKPYDLMAQLVLDWTDENELIYDLTAGGCTTLLAAALNGRRAWGIEKREPICELAAKRLEAELSGWGGATKKGSPQRALWEIAPTTTEELRSIVKP